MPERTPLAFDPIAEARARWISHDWSIEAAAGMAAMTSILRIEQIVKTRVDRVLEVFNLSTARYELLVLLLFANEGKLSLTRIGQRLQVRPASVTSLVDQLTEQRLVKRRPNPADGRSTLALITDKGRRVAIAAIERLNEEVYPTLGLVPDDLEQLIALMTKVRSAAGDFVDGS